MKFSCRGPRLRINKASIYFVNYYEDIPRRANGHHGLWSPELDPYKHIQLVFNTMRKKCPFNNGAKRIRYPQRKEIQTHIFHKITQTGL